MSAITNLLQRIKRQPKAPHPARPMQPDELRHLADAYVLEGANPEDARAMAALEVGATR